MRQVIESDAKIGMMPKVRVTVRNSTTAGGIQRRNISLNSSVVVPGTGSSVTPHINLMSPLN